VDGHVQQDKAAPMNPISTTAERRNFADYVALHLPFLNRVVRRLMRGDEMAEDVVQQTVLKALKHANQFRFESTLKTWLTSIAVNEVYQTYRRVSRSRAVPLAMETSDVDRCQGLEFPKNTYEARERGTPCPKRGLPAPGDVPVCRGVVRLKVRPDEESCTGIGANASCD
jgi:RNA polymerase sigma factor (sigma-70 family)